MSDLEEHLVEEGAPVPASPKKLSCHSQDMVCAPKILRGSAFCKEVMRHSSSHIYTLYMSPETKRVYIGRKSQNKCAVITVKSARI